MLDIGFLELLVIAVLGLVVLGPERLPKAARTLGLWLGQVKRTVAGMQREINAQLEAEELRQKLKEQQQKLDESIRQAKREVEELAERDDRQTPDSADANDASDTAKEAAAQRADTDEAVKEAAEPSATTPEQRLDDALARARLASSSDDKHDTPSPPPTRTSPLNEQDR